MLRRTASEVHARTMRRRRHRNPATAADLYSIASDAVKQFDETGEEKLVAEAKQIVAEARETFPTASVPSRVQHLVDFDDEEVLRDFEAAFPKAESLEIEEDLVWSQPAFRVTVDGDVYIVLRSDDAAREAALEAVTQDLKQDPSLFNHSFLERHIDEEKLKKYVYDVRMEDDYVEELASRQPRDFWRLAAQLGIEPETDDEDAEPDPDDYVERVKEAYAEDVASRPMEFFNDMYGGQEALDRAVEVAGIDIQAGAQDVVDSDGWQNSLSHYDGKSDETNAGFVYWRDS